MGDGMEAGADYLASRKTLWATLLAASFLAASVFLFVAITACLFIQYSDLMILALLLGTAGLDAGIAWLLKQKNSRGFWLNIVFTSIAIAVGSIVVSMVVWHGHWTVTITELLRELRPGP
jgi:predicted MFS family arabinose efflux permease